MNTVAQTARAQSRVLGLDLLRGLCAIAVVVYHFLSWLYRWPIESVGAFAVYTFFVLSGLTMTMVYGHRFELGVSSSELAAFFKARVARLLPMLAFAASGTFVAMVAFAHASPVDEGIKTILTATGLFGLGAPGLLSNVTGGWSLGIEGMFYLLFPTLAVLSAQTRWRPLATWGVALLVAQQLTSLLILRSGLPFWYFYVSPLTFAPFFLFGMAIAKAPRKESYLALGIMMAMLAGLFAFSLTMPTVDLYATPWAYVLLTAVSVCATWSAFRAAIPRYLAPFAAFLGDISYSLYLTHWLTYVLAGQIAGQLGWGGYGETALFAVLALAIAYASHRLVEVPARDAIRGAFRRTNPAPAAPA
jgi:peptidoglycan/LPS O-acetylase OafA/YrhL